MDKTSRSISSKSFPTTFDSLSVQQIQLQEKATRERRPIIQVEYPQAENEDHVTLTIFAVERHGLLADITEYLQSAKLNVRQATIHTLPNNSVMDRFVLHDPTNVLADDASMRRIHDTLVQLVHSAPIQNSRNLPPLTASRPSSLSPSLHTSPHPSLNSAPSVFRRHSSNIALTDLEEEHRQEREAARRKSDALTANFVEHALSTLITGEYLYYYSSATRYRYRFAISEDGAYLTWAESRTVPISNYAGCVFGAQTPTFRSLDSAHLVDPEWLCFSLVAKNSPRKLSSFSSSHPSTIDLVCVSDDQLNRWLLGLQTLCSSKSSPVSSQIPVSHYTLNDLIRYRVKYKIRAQAKTRRLTSRSFILRRVRDAARTRTSLDPHFFHRDEVTSLELELTRLRRILIDNSRRQTLLNTAIRDFQTSWEVNFETIQFLHPIGQGAFSEMWKALWRSTPVAVKKLTTRTIPELSSVTPLKPLSAASDNFDPHSPVTSQSINAKMSEEDRRLLHDFRLEVTMLNKLRHPNVVMFLGAVTTAPHMCILTEFCNGGSLFSALRKKSWRTCLSLEDLRNVARQIARAFCYLHAMRIIHRDLKSQNLLLDRPVEEGCPVVKVADFGLSRNFNGIGTVTGSVTGVMTSETGTYRWMAPEIIRHEPYNEKVDVYSYGIVLWELFSCEIPFAGMTPIQAAFAVADKHLRPRCESEYAKDIWIPPAWQALLEHCWHPSAGERPRFKNLLRILDEMETCTNGEIPPSLQKQNISTSKFIPFANQGGGAGLVAHLRRHQNNVDTETNNIMEEHNGHDAGSEIELAKARGQTGLGRSGSSPLLRSSEI